MSEVGEILRTYYAIPDHYTIGREFDTFEEAIMALVEDIQSLSAVSLNRGYVDERLEKRENGITSDHTVNRWLVECKKDPWSTEVRLKESDVDASS